MGKKVLFITQYFHPENTAGSIRADSILEILNKDNDVTVFTTYPNHPYGIVYERYSNKLYSIDEYKGTKVFRNKILCFKNNNMLKRLITYMSFPLFGILNVIFNRKKIGDEFDIIYISSGPFFCAASGYIISKIFRRPFIIEFRDLVYLVFEKKRGMLYKIIKIIEVFLAQKAESVVVTTCSFKKSLFSNGISKNKIKVITNIINIKSIKLFPKATGDDRTIKLLYIGNLGLSQDILELIQIIENIDDKKIQLKIIGEGAEKEKLAEYIYNNNCNNISIAPPIQYDKRGLMYRKADYLVVKLKSDIAYSNFIPSKLFDIMSFGKPVIYIGPKGEVSKIINEANCGITITEKTLKEKIEQIKIYFNRFECNDFLRDEVYELGINGINYIDKNMNDNSIELLK